MLRKTQAFELKSIDESGEFEGIASVYGNKDSYGDVVEPGAFTKTISERGTGIPILWQHGEPIGKGEVTDAGGYLHIKGKILEGVTHGADAIKLAKAGIVKGLSIGYRTIKSQWDVEAKVMRLQELKLYEVSFVTFPANELAMLTGIKSETDDDEAIRTIYDYQLSIKAGRTLSASTRQRLQSTIEALSALLTEADALDEAAKSLDTEPQKHSVDLLAALREFRKKR